MHLRRTFAALAAVAAAPMLASCGFSLNTDTPYTPATGINEQTERVDVLSAVVVSGQEGSGTFIATLSNRSQTEPITFTSVQGAEGNAITPGDVEPLEIPPGDFVNLVDDGGGVTVGGTFQPGDVVPVSIGFEDGTDISTEAVVVRPCGEYDGLDISGGASPSDEPSLTPTDGPETVEDDPTADAEAEPSDTEGSATAEESDDAESDPYACTYTPEED